MLDAASYYITSTTEKMKYKFADPYPKLFMLDALYSYGICYKGYNEI